MARASYQNLKGVGFSHGRKPRIKRDVERLSLKAVKPQITVEPTPVIIPKPANQTILKIRTPLN